jgi:hypothetical protein
MSIISVKRPPVNRKHAGPPHGVARLTLHVNGTAYFVEPIPITGSVATKLYRLRTADGANLTVASTLDGLSCDCCDPNPSDCEHVRAMLAVGLFDGKGGAR